MKFSFLLATLTFKVNSSIFFAIVTQVEQRTKPPGGNEIDTQIVGRGHMSTSK